MYNLKRRSMKQLARRRVADKPKRWNELTLPGTYVLTTTPSHFFPEENVTELGKVIEASPVESAPTGHVPPSSGPSDTCFPLVFLCQRVSRCSQGSQHAFWSLSTSSSELSATSGHSAVMPTTGPCALVSPTQGDTASMAVNTAQ